MNEYDDNAQNDMGEKNIKRKNDPETKCDYTIERSNAY